MKLIINADDFGYSKAVNYGILEGFKEGILTSTTLMVNMPGAEHAFNLMEEYGDILRVGIHLTLGAGVPVSREVPTLIDNRGYFLKKHEILGAARLEDIEREFNAQFEKFLGKGYMPTHIDSHYHTHRDPQILSILLKLADRYNLPIRALDRGGLLKSAYPHIKTIDHFIGEFYQDIDIETFEQLIEGSLSYGVVELMCHPGYVDTLLLENSSYTIQRAKELSILTDPKLRGIIEKYHIDLINYKKL